MGYETIMLVVQKCNSQMHSSVLIEEINADSKGDRFTEKVYPCYKEDGNYIYYPDNNTKTYVPSGAIIKEGPWCMVIATMDLSKAGSFPGICQFKDSDGCYAYNPFDGNETIGMDPYGDYRKFVPLQEVIDIIQTYVKDAEDRGEVPYRQYVSALALLNGVKASFNNTPTVDYTARAITNEVGCLFWGH